MIKEIKVPTLNEILGIEDRVRFKFLYRNKLYKNRIAKSCTYTIINNKLLFADDIPYTPSCLLLNEFYNENLIGIEIVDD